MYPPTNISGGFFIWKLLWKGVSKISRNKFFIVGAICTLLMLISGIYAFTNISVLNVTNEVNTGAVKISLNEYTVENGNESLYNQSEDIVFPGIVITFLNNDSIWETY